MFVEHLNNRLRIAFASRNIPQSVSDGCSRSICKQLENEFRGRSIDLLSVSDIKFLSIELTLLNDDAFAYFLPKILSTALDSIESVDFFMLVQNLLFIPEQPNVVSLPKQRLKQFNISESDAILEVLDYWYNLEGFDQIWKESIKKTLPFWRKRAKR